MAYTFIQSAFYQLHVNLADVLHYIAFKVYIWLVDALQSLKDWIYCLNNKNYIYIYLQFYYFTIYILCCLQNK